MLDNCAIHWVNAIREIVEAQGALMIFLPPYSPDFNPIEESFSYGASSSDLCSCFLSIL